MRDGRHALSAFVEEIGGRWRQSASEDRGRIRGRLELVYGSYPFRTAVVLYNHDTETLKILKKDRYGEFDRFRTKPLEVSEIRPLLRKESVEQDDRTAVNRAVNMVLGKNFGDRKNDLMLSVGETLRCVYGQTLFDSDYNVLDHDARWTGERLEHGVLVRFQLSGDDAGRGAEWLVEDQVVQPKNALAEEISNHRYTRADYVACFEKVHGPIR